MSESTTFDDLELLDGSDLNAVFRNMDTGEVVAALWGAPIGLRGRLLRKLHKRDSMIIEQGIAGCEHCTFDQVRNAQQKAVSIMCHMSRSGQIAFDAPEDMVA
jgi:flagellar motor switch protein FliG